jgi:hypothetical protein
MPEHPEADYPPITLSARTLLKVEVYALALLYWPWDEVDNAVNVAELESGFATAAWNNHGEDSRGLWQINVGPGAHPDLRNENLFDPQVNSYYAGLIWRHSGWAAWYNSARKLGLL